MSTAKEIMSKSVVSTAPNTTISEAARLMDEKEIGCLLVTDGDKFVGIMTERDVLTSVVAKGLPCEETMVSEIMSKNLITVDVDADIYEISKIFNKHNIRRLPVTENDKIVGMLTSRDVVNALRYMSARRITSKEYGRPEYIKTEHPEDKS